MFEQPPVVWRSQGERSRVGRGDPGHGACWWIRRPRTSTPRQRCCLWGNVPVTTTLGIVTTSVTVPAFEGQAFPLGAPLELQHPNFGRLVFLHWQMDGGILFPAGMNSITPVVVREAAMTAVYGLAVLECTADVDSPMRTASLPGASV